MSRIKSAFERAMERASSLEQPSESQRLEWELAPKGERLAGDYLHSRGAPFSAIEKEPEERRRYLQKAMAGVLARNISLPRSDAANSTNERVLEGLERLLPGNAKLKEIITRIRHVCDQYRQYGMPQREQTYAQLKAQMESRVEMMARQTGQPAPAHMPNVEMMPEFQEQWRNISGQLDGQYEQHLEQFRQQLRELTE